MRALSKRRDHDYDEDDDDARDYWIVAGGDSYCAVCFPEPGCRAGDDEEVAAALSIGIMSATYHLELAEYCERVTAYVDGIELGVVAEYPEAVADALGCPLDGKPSLVRRPVDLTPHLYPTAGQGEATIIGYTARQWRHLIDYEREWRCLLDGATAEHGFELLPYLRGSDRDLRRLAVDLLRAIGAGQLGDACQAVVEQLRASAADPGLLHECRVAADRLLDALTLADE